jgi:hypothetical protein
MRKLALTALLAFGMALGASSAIAAPQRGSGEQVTLTDGGQPASGDTFVLDLANAGKIADATGVTDNNGTPPPNVVANLTTVGTVQAQTYYTVCRDGKKHVVMVNAGEKPKDDDTCGAWIAIGGPVTLTGNDKITIEVGATPSISVTPQTTMSVGTPSNTYPHWEFSGNFDYFRDRGASENYAGFDGSVLYKPTSMFGFGADITYMRLFGQPDFSGSLGFYNGELEAGCKHGHVTPYADIQLGVVHSTNSNSAFTAEGTGSEGGTMTIFFPASTSSSNAFDFMAGGGLRWSLGPHIDWNVARVNYVLTTFSSSVQNNFTVAGGLTFRY